MRGGPFHVVLLEQKPSSPVQTVRTTHARPGHCFPSVTLPNPAASYPDGSTDRETETKFTKHMCPWGRPSKEAPFFLPPRVGAQLAFPQAHRDQAHAHENPHFVFSKRKHFTQNLQEPVELH